MRLQTRTFRRCAGALATLVVLAAGGTAATAATNLMPNGTFEGSGSGSLSGWGASGGTLSLVAGDGSQFAARVTAGSGVTKVYAYTSQKPVSSTTAGTQYSLGGAIRSDQAGQTVCLVVKEQPSGSTKLVGSAQSCATTATAWATFPPVSYTTVASGDVLTVNVLENSPAAGATYDIDNLSLVAGAVDVTAPSVPSITSATATGPSTVALAWSPSTDNTGGSGLAGYDVYRDGSATPLATLGASATGYTDGSAAPSTAYTYTVDAFDAAGNHSSQSAPAGVTTPAAPPGPCGILPAPAGPITYAHVIVVMDENLSYNNWRGSAAAPFTNQLANQCALASRAVGATHPSQPNYVAATSGYLQVWNGSQQHYAGDNLFHQLGAAGLTWQALEEGMPSPCYAKTVFPYKNGHNPAIWFTDLGASGSGGDGSCKLDDVPFGTSSFDPSTLGAFTWVTPNQCDDMHWVTGCSGSKSAAVAAGDAWLQSFLNTIFATPDYQQGNTLVLLMWDEGNESGTKGIDCTAVTNIDTTGCHVPLIAASAYITPGTVDGASYSDYSVLAALENMWGLPLLNRAQTATPLGPDMGF